MNSISEQMLQEEMLPRQLTDPMKRSERISKYYDLVFGAKQKLGIERARLVTQAYKEYPSHYNCMRRAYAMDKVLKNYRIFIEPYTLIVGNQTEHGPGKHAPLFPEVYGSELARMELVAIHGKDPREGISGPLTIQKLLLKRLPKFSNIGR